MRRCPITYEEIGSNRRYSISGLRWLSPRLDDLEDFPYTQPEQIQESLARAAKMSLQGVQPKLSVKLDVPRRLFQVVDTGGRFLLKPQNPLYSELPQNEDLSMRLASLSGIEIPLHGLIYCRDSSFSYFVKRFDRRDKTKLAVEDIAQLSGLTRETKYDFSMERLAAVLEQYTTFPQLEKLKLFRLALFNYLIGNEDAHVKNFSLIRRGQKVELAPAYDLLNTTIAVPGTVEEIALPLDGKKRKLSRQSFFDYFARRRLELPTRAVDQVAAQLSSSIAHWPDWISASFLSREMKENYRAVLERRRTTLGL